MEPSDKIESLRMDVKCAQTRATALESTRDQLTAEVDRLTRVLAAEVAAHAETKDRLEDVLYDRVESRSPVGPPRMNATPPESLVKGRTLKAVQRAISTPPTIPVPTPSCNADQEAGEGR